VNISQSSVAILTYGKSFHCYDFTANVLFISPKAALIPITLDTGQCQKNFIIRSYVVSLQAHFSNATGRVILHADSDASITNITFTPTVPLGVICHDLKFEYEYENTTVLNGGCTVVFIADVRPTIELKVNTQNGKQPSDLLLRCRENTAVGISNTGRLWYGYRLDDIAVTRNSIHVVMCVHCTSGSALVAEKLHYALSVNIVLNAA